MIRLFLAVSLPTAIRHSLLPLCNGLPGARWEREKNLHLTLRFIGEVPEDVAQSIDDEMRTLRQPAFSLRLSGLGTFHQGRHGLTLWAGLERQPALYHLQESLESALVRLDLPPEPRKFTPHVTLAKLRNTPSHRLQDYIEGNNLYQSEPFAVESFTLFQSHLGHEGAVYLPLAEYPLVLG